MNIALLDQSIRQNIFQMPTVAGAAQVAEANPPPRNAAPPARARAPDPNAPAPNPQAARTAAAQHDDFKERVLDFSRHGAAISMYTCNDLIYSGALWYLFPFGVVGATGPLPPWLRNHLLQHASGRFETDAVFVHLLLSQDRANQAARNIRANPKAAKKLNKLMGKADFKRKLAAAAADPTNAANSKFMAEIRSVVCVGMRGIPFTLGEKRRTFNELINLVRFNGAPTFHFTFQFSAINCVFGVSYVSVNSARVTREEYAEMSYATRRDIIMSNPMAAVRYFRDGIEFVFKEILKCDIEYNPRGVVDVREARPGPFGTVVAARGVVEAQDRSSLLHLHTLVWASPGVADGQYALLAALDGRRLNGQTWNVIRAHRDQCQRSSLPPEMWEEIRRRYTNRPPPPTMKNTDETDEDELRSDMGIMILRQQLHAEHRLSCFYDLNQGDCRYGFRNPRARRRR